MHRTHAVHALTRRPRPCRRRLNLATTDRKQPEERARCRDQQPILVQPEPRAQVRREDIRDDCHRRGAEQRTRPRRPRPRSCPALEQARPSARPAPSPRVTVRATPGLPSLLGVALGARPVSGVPRVGREAATVYPPACPELSRRPRAEGPHEAGADWNDGRLDRDALPTRAGVQLRAVSASSDPRRAGTSARPSHR
jgi:hypothetical protein